MKKFILFGLILSLCLSSVAAQAVRGQSLNGSTGLFSIPTGRIGWETGSNFGIDFGYRAIINNDAGTAHIPALTLSLVKYVEISAAYDIKPDGRGRYRSKDNDDLLLGLKIKLPTKNTAISIGSSFQFINLGNDAADYNAFQPYIAITYPGTFFTMPAETTLVFGKTFYSGGPKNNTNIDFGMGFDLILFPDVFGNAVHWIIDFANFSYSASSWPYDQAGWRGVLNMGARIDLSVIPALNKVKLLIDFVFNDLFDDGHRSFTIGAVFGVSP
jgi:hypothetical protein